ncbi:MAG: TraB/GumN family protein [Deltaproteobacteria bacterium]|nr:TraB/GumN family protein [Deltaproteobacteria bacterium]
MDNNDNNNMVKRLYAGDKEVILIGTAHVSRESAELVSRVILEEKPDSVCVELCESRYQSIQQKELWQDTNIIKIIREKKAFLLLSKLLLASFQKKLANKFDIKPGEEMIRAIQAGKDVSASILPVDRDIRITLSRSWRIMGLWEKAKLLFQFLGAAGDVDDISEEDIEKMKKEDMLQSILSDVEKSHPVLRKILIDERDIYMAQKIKDAPGKKTVAVAGAGHLPGIVKHWETDIDLGPLEELPPGSKLARIIKWAIPAAIIGLFVLGFLQGGVDTGRDMIKWWLLANGILAGIGALIALAHPLTILTAILAAPLTSLNPMIAAGWVSGMTEAFLRKPKVRDFENLSEDILSLKGFWRNNVTRILLVVVLTNIGSVIGTMVAFPLILSVV